MTAVEPLNIVRPFRLRVEDFFLLDRAGAFAGHGKTELIDGAIVFMNAQHRPHARMKSACYDALRAALQEQRPDLAVLIEATVAMPPNDAPEPDLVVTSEPDGDGPVPLASVALIVEIADTTLADDLGTKRGRYAINGVPEYWVVDLRGRILHQQWAPEGEDYVRSAQVPIDQAIEVQTLADVRIGPIVRA